MAGPIRNMMSRIRSRRMARRARRRGGSSQGNRNYIDPMESMAASDGAQSYNIGVDSPPTQIMAGRGDEMMGGTVIDGAVQMPGGMPAVSPETGRMIPMTDGRAVPATDTTSTAPAASDIASGWRPFPGAQTAQYGSGQMFSVPSQPKCSGPNCQQNVQNSYGLPPGAVILSERTVTSAPQATTQMGTASPQATTQMAPGTAAVRGGSGSSMPVMRPKGWQPPAGMPGAMPSAPLQPSAPLEFGNYGQWFSNRGVTLANDPSRFLTEGAQYAIADADRLDLLGRKAEAIQMRTLAGKHFTDFREFIAAEHQRRVAMADPNAVPPDMQRQMLTQLLDQQKVETRAKELQTDPDKQREAINAALDDFNTDSYTRAMQVARLSWPQGMSEEAMRMPEWRAHINHYAHTIQRRQFANAWVGQQAAYDSEKAGVLRPSGRDAGEVQSALHLDNPAAWRAFSERYLPMYQSDEAGTTGDERLAFIQQDAMTHLAPALASALSSYEATSQRRQPTKADYEDAFARATMVIGNYVAYIPVYTQSNRQDAEAAGRFYFRQQQERQAAEDRAAAAAAAAMQE